MVDEPTFDPTSILDSVKKLLGIEFNYTQFDPDVMVGINSALMTLNQLGFDSFVVTDRTDVWSDFLGTGTTNYEAVKSYVYLKTRLMFDPPSSSALLEAFERQINQYEWRLQIQKEEAI